MLFKTYDEWKASGYQVRRGQKATSRNPQGYPTFSDAQVDEEQDPDDYGEYEDYDTMDILY